LHRFKTCKGLIFLNIQHENGTFVLKPTVLKDTDLDEIHSFVLRISVNRAHGGKGKPRPQFQLEHVNSGLINRMTNVGEVLDQLETRITSVLDGFELHQEL